MGLFGKTQEKPPKELVRASDRGSYTLGSGGGNSQLRSQAGPHFRGFPLRRGAEGRV